MICSTDAIRYFCSYLKMYNDSKVIDSKVLSPLIMILIVLYRISVAFCEDELLFTLTFSVVGKAILLWIVHLMFISMVGNGLRHNLVHLGPWHTCRKGHHSVVPSDQTELHYQHLECISHEIYQSMSFGSVFGYIFTPHCIRIIFSIHIHQNSLTGTGINPSSKEQYVSFVVKK